MIHQIVTESGSHALVSLGFQHLLGSYHGPSRGCDWAAVWGLVTYNRKAEPEIQPVPGFPKAAAQGLLYERWKRTEV